MAHALVRAASRLVSTPYRQRMTAARNQPFFQVRDLAWLLFTVWLIFADPETNYNATIVLGVMGAFQIAEPRLRAFSSRRGQIASVALKLILCWLVMGYTHSIDSFYYLIFLIPVISAATTFEALGVTVVTAIASLGYFAFLLPIFIDWTTYQMPPGLISLMFLRICFYAIVAFVVYQQAKAKRREMERTKLAEASLRRSERLAALGQLTAGLAHELRNPLGTIKASAEMLAKPSTRQRPEVMAEMAEYIGSEADRMNGLVSTFLDFARPLKLHPVQADLRPVLEDISQSLNEAAHSRGITISIELHPEPFSFTFDPALLRIAISNLMQNAIQASAAGGRVDMRAEERGGNILIFVSDHGEGIQPQHLENIFNPFFTTKPAGTGLGLAIVSRIVDEHHGRVTVFSQPGAGTTFELTLPKEQRS
ncbi:MAG: sensor histidine kinase [Bryobacteraceae bacterium]